MSKRITLDDSDIELIIKLLKDADCGTGFGYIASKQRVATILAKLAPPQQKENK